MTGRRKATCWDYFWQLAAILIWLATLLIEIMGWSGYVPRLLRADD